MLGAVASEDCWCYKCKKFYTSCVEAAAQAGLVVVDGLYCSKITLECLKKQHHFTISYSKKLHTLSCSDCRREERDEWKEQLRQEELKRNQDYLKKQQELFEKARKCMEDEERTWNTNTTNTSSSSSSTSSMRSYYV